jgi:hypothetical protein
MMMAFDDWMASFFCWVFEDVMWCGKLFGMLYLTHT